MKLYMLPRSTIPFFPKGNTFSKVYWLHGFIQTFPRHVGFFGLECICGGVESRAICRQEVEDSASTSRPNKNGEAKKVLLDNRTLESLARRSAGRTEEQLRRSAKTPLPRNQLLREDECARLAMQCRFTSLIIFP